MNIFLERASGFYPGKPSRNKEIIHNAESGHLEKKPGGRGFEKASQLSFASKFPSGPLNMIFDGNRNTVQENETEKKVGKNMGFHVNRRND